MFRILKSRTRNRIEDLRTHFDCDYYLSQINGDAGNVGDPVEHYYKTGATRGLDPSPEFSTTYYLAANDDVAKSGVNPFWHYIVFGKHEGRPGRPGKSQAQARAEDADLMLVLSEFDAAHYRGRHPELTGTDRELAEHYLTTGWRLGHNPNEEFHTALYVACHPDVAARAANPFVHYLKFGRGEGRYLPAPPDMNQPGLPDDLQGILQTMRPHFDASFYMDSNPDATMARHDPVLHYCLAGWRENLDPHPDFSTADYLAANLDVRDAGINPFWHYIVRGMAEGRRVAPGEPGVPIADNLHEIEAIRPHFSPDHYLRRYDDVAKAGVDPLIHYCAVGWREGRDPAPDFSTSYYIDANPDIRDAGVNPFWHYIVAGKSEGRSPQHPGGYKARILSELPPLEEEVETWMPCDEPARRLSARQIRSQVSASLTPERNRLILAVTHDNYRRNGGGVQLCLQREEAMSEEHGAAYLAIYPLRPLPRLAHPAETPDPDVGLILNGQYLGPASMSRVTEAVTGLRGDAEEISLVIHHLIGHLTEAIADLARAAGTSECLFWAHDFFALCPSFTLQRNDVGYCDAPPAISNACALCRYGAERKDHLTRMNAFFSDLDVHVVFPSESTQSIWHRRAGVTPARETVLPHIELTHTAHAAPTDATFDAAVRVGFLGRPATYKGWPLFEKLVLQHRNDDRYAFFYLGTTDIGLPDVTSAAVDVTAENPDAMTDAVASHELDLVIHWASWPETFSITAYEALSGGAYLVTNSVSGNIADTVERIGRGLVLQTEDEILAAFDSGTIRDLAERRRKDRAAGYLRPSTGKLSYTILEGGAHP